MFEFIFGVFVAGAHNAVRVLSNELNEKNNNRYNGKQKQYNNTNIIKTTKNGFNSNRLCCPYSQWIANGNCMCINARMDGMCI